MQLQVDIETEKHAARLAYIRALIDTYIHTRTHTHTHPYIHNIHTYIHNDRCRSIYRDRDIHTYMHTYIE